MGALATAFFNENTLRFGFLGLASGALYALVALGLVLTYRASGVLNFSVGSMGAISAYEFFALRDGGPQPILGETTHIYWGLALVIALVLGVVIGLFTHFLVMVVLRKVSLLGKLIATLGLMTFGQGFVGVIYDTRLRTPQTFFPTDPTKLWFTSNVYVPLERLILIGLVLAVAAILRLIYSKTLFGLATTGVAENRRVAAASGYSPTIIEMVNFAVAGLLSAGAAILLSPIVGLQLSVLTLMVLPALAAALVGRFSSFTVTVVAALVIGMLQALVSYFQGDIAGWFGWNITALTGIAETVPLVIIIAVTMATGRTRPQRGEVLTRLPLPGDGHITKPLLAIGGIIGVVMLWRFDPAWNDALITTFAYGILLISVVVLTGYCGQLSLAQFALAGFGVWAAARLIATQDFSLLMAIIAGVILTIPVGLLVALPALRTRGVNLAVATLGLAQVMYSVIFNNGELTGGYNGTTVATTKMKIFGINLDPISQPKHYGGFVLVLLLLCGIIAANVRRGRAGRRMLAVRANERAAASLGVSVYGAKLYAFGFASAIAALAGISLGLRSPSVQFVSFDVFGSITAALYAVVGGIGWVSGTIIGAFQAPGSLGNKITNEVLTGVQNTTNYLLLFSGVVVFMIFRNSPDGLAKMHSVPFHHLLRKIGLEKPSTKPPARLETRRDRPASELKVENVTVRFGGVVALNGVSFEVHPGEVVGLIGPNGAGKTTMLDVITGFTKPQEGQVTLDGTVVDEWSPEKRARMGMARSWQAVELFEEMTVRENLLVAADRQSPKRYFIDLVHPGRAGATEVMEEVIAEFDLAEHLDGRPSGLSHGTARLVGIARAIATEPSVLLLDEPAAGLDAGESQELGLAIRRVARERGIGVLIIEHDVALLMNICDRIVVLDFGRKIAEGTPQEVAADPEVIRAYLGEPSAQEKEQAGDMTEVTQ